MRKQRATATIYIPPMGRETLKMWDEFWKNYKSKHMIKRQVTALLLAEGISSSYSGNDRTFYMNKLPSEGLQQIIMEESTFGISTHPPPYKWEKAMKHHARHRMQLQRIGQIEDKNITTDTILEGGTV